MQTKITLQASNLKDSLKKISKFMSNEETRYYLCGVYWQIEGEHLKLTATNGHILCEMNLEPSIVEAGENYNVIIPAKAVKDILKICPKCSGENDFPVKITVENEQIVTFDFLDFDYKTKVVDGSFPDSSKVIPEGKNQVLANFKGAYIAAAIQAFNRDPVSIFCDSDEEEIYNSPHLIKSAAHPGIKCVLMPMRA